MNEMLRVVCTDRGQHKSRWLTSVDWDADEWDTTHASAEWVEYKDHKTLWLRCKCGRAWRMRTERLRLLRQWPHQTVDISAMP